MRFLAYTDLHTASWAIKDLKKKIKEHKPDYLINGGDFAIFDNETERIMKDLDKLGVPTLLIHGNHETDTVVEYLCEKSKNLKFIHGKVLDIGGITFVGWGGGGFYYATDEELGFEEWLKETKPKLKKPTVFLMHAPPLNTNVDDMDGEHVGCGSYTRFIKKNSDKIVLALSGHIHETFYNEDTIKKTKLLNPGPAGTIIDIDPKTGKVEYTIDKPSFIPEMY